MVRKTPKSAARILKDKGLIPSNYRLDRLSVGQKSWVTKQIKKFSEVVKEPHNFATVKVSTAKHRQQAQAAGFKVTNGRAVVRATGGKATISRRGDKLTIRAGGTTKEVYFANAPEFSKMLEKAARTKLKHNQHWSFSVGTNESGLQFRSIKELVSYLQKAKWKEKDIERYVSLTKVTEEK